MPSRRPSRTWHRSPWPVCPRDRSRPDPGRRRRFAGRPEQAVAVDPGDGTASRSDAKIDVEGGQRQRRESRRACGLWTERARPWPAAPTSALVPPTSRVMHSGKPAARARQAAQIAPAAGPDSAVRMGKRRGIPIDISPPALWLTVGEQGMPRPVTDFFRRSRYACMTVRRAAFRAVVENRSNSRILRMHFGGGDTRVLPPIISAGSRPPAARGRAGVGVEEADGDAVHLSGRSRRPASADIGLVQFDVHLPVRQRALPHLQAQRPLDQRYMFLKEKIVGVRPIDPPDLINVAKAFGDQERGARAGALQNGVDRYCRSREETAQRSGNRCRLWRQPG